MKKTENKCRNEKLRGFDSECVRILDKEMTDTAQKKYDPFIWAKLKSA